MDNYPIAAQGLINKSVLMQIKAHLAPTWIRFVAAVLGVTFSFLVIININRSYAISMVFLACVVFLYVLYQCCVFAVIKQQLDILDVLFHTSHLVYTLYFQDQAMCLTVHGKEKSPVYIPYSEFRTVMECRNYYLMVTYKKTLIVIEKETLNISKADWKNFLNEKCSQVKLRI